MRSDALRPRVDKTGKTYGKITVVSFSHMHGKKAYWNCLCSCEPDGKPWLVRGDRLVEGKATSCGCLVRDTNATHGMEGTRVYEIWRSMRKRCHSENAPNYDLYGGRGIKVCDHWRESFESFYTDMGDPPSDAHTLDRRDTNGHYEPGNCRWATNEEQQNNRRNNTVLEHDGQRMTVAQWGRKLGLHKDTILRRLARGWSVRDALTKPLQN